MAKPLIQILSAKPPVHGPPVFVPQDEGTRRGERQAFKRNQRFAVSGPYQTQLGTHGEAKFRVWANKVNQLGAITIPVQGKTDYDYRGYFKKFGGKAWSPGSHFPDTFKTPLDTTFSRESKYATPDNPFVWRGNRLVNRRNGRLVAVSQ